MVVFQNYPCSFVIRDPQSLSNPYMSVGFVSGEKYPILSREDPHELLDDFCISEGESCDLSFRQLRGQAG